MASADPLSIPTKKADFTFVSAMNDETFEIESLHFQTEQDNTVPKEPSIYDKTFDSLHFQTEQDNTVPKEPSKHDKTFGVGSLHFQTEQDNTVQEELSIHDKTFDSLHFQTEQYNTVPEEPSIHDEKLEEILQQVPSIVHNVEPSPEDSPGKVFDFSAEIVEVVNTTIHDIPPSNENVLPIPNEEFYEVVEKHRRSIGIVTNTEPLNQLELIQNDANTTMEEAKDSSIIRNEVETAILVSINDESVEEVLKPAPAIINKNLCHLTESAVYSPNRLFLSEVLEKLTLNCSADDTFTSCLETTNADETSEIELTDSAINVPTNEKVENVEEKNQTVDLEDDGYTIYNCDLALCPDINMTHEETKSLEASLKSSADKDNYIKYLDLKLELNHLQQEVGRLVVNIREKEGEIIKIQPHQITFAKLLKNENVEELSKDFLLQTKQELDNLKEQNHKLEQQLLEKQDENVNLKQMLEASSQLESKYKDLLLSSESILAESTSKLSETEKALKAERERNQSLKGAFDVLMDKYDQAKRIVIGMKTNERIYVDQIEQLRTALIRSGQNVAIKPKNYNEDKENVPKN